MIWLLLLTWMAPEAREPSPQDKVVEAMLKHDREAIAARDALIHGDLEGAKDEARKLEKRVPVAGLSPDLDVLQARVDEAARDVVEAKSIAEASAAMGRMVVACGGCHQATDARPEVTEPAPLPKEGDGVRAEMQRHDGAMQLVWNGLVAPSDADLVAGAKRFRDSSLSVQSGELAAAAKQLDDTSSDLAEAVAKASLREERADKFGALLTTCATCHLLRPGGIRIEPQ
jgi:cytochrome c553